MSYNTESMITREEVALSRRLGDVLLHATNQELPWDERPVFVRAAREAGTFDRLPLCFRERIVELETLATARRSAGTP